MIYLEEIQAECGRIAKEKGWDDEPVDFGMTLALIHSELSEALEEYRLNRGKSYIYHTYQTSDGSTFMHEGDVSCTPNCDKKPEGIPVELADAIIRILHFANVEGINMEKVVLDKIEYNATREYRHGDKLA